MTPTDTDRLLASARASAEAGLSLCSYDVLRLLRVIEEHGREVLRLRAETKRLEGLLLDEPRPLSETEEELARARIAVDVLRRKLDQMTPTEAPPGAAPRATSAEGSTPSLSRPCSPPSSPTPPTGAPAAALSSVDAGSEGGSRAEARSPVCPDCRGSGVRRSHHRSVCLTCAGEGLLGGGR